MSFYAAAPNDVWSLGVILVNLTCGRNPWKRACIEDSTFRAYLRNPCFLKSILPLSDDMVCILSRIFDLDPAKRITIPELRRLVIECPRFTTTPMTPWVANAVPRPIDYVQDPGVFVPSPVESPLDTLSDDSSDASSVYSTFSNSDVSDVSSLTEDYSDVASVPSDSSVDECLSDAFSCKDEHYVFPPLDPSAACGLFDQVPSPCVVPNAFYGSLYPITPVAPVA